MTEKETDKEQVESILVAGNEAWTGEEILKELNKAGYYIVKMNDLHKGCCPSCGCQIVEGNIDYDNP